MAHISNAVCKRPKQRIGSHRPTICWQTITQISKYFNQYLIMIFMLWACNSLSLCTLKRLQFCFQENGKFKTHSVKVTRLGSGERAQTSLNLCTIGGQIVLTGSRLAPGSTTSELTACHSSQTYPAKRKGPHVTTIAWSAVHDKP